MRKVLRDYQEDACNKALEKLKKGESFLLNMATGSGKTVVFLNIAKEYLKQGKKILILVNDNSLLQQNINNINEELEIEEDIAVEHGKTNEIINGVKQGNLKNISISTRATMAFKDEMHSIPRYDMIPPDTFDLIIIDEAHHMVGNQFQQILDRFKSTPVLGVTATPQLANEINISSKYFNGNEYYYGIKQAMLNKNLAHLKVKNYKIPELINKINNIKENKNTDDFSDEIIGKIISEDSIKKQFIDIIGENAKDKKTAVFCPTIKSAKEIKVKLENKYPEYKILMIHSKMDDNEKEKIKKEYENAKKNTIMVNVTMLTEGYDCKDIDCIINLRATKSEVLYRQIAGRETRTAEGKKFGVFINLFDGCKKVLQPASLMRENDESLDSPVLNVMQKILDSKQTDDLLNARLKAEQIIKYIEKYSIGLIFRDEAKFELKTEKNLEQLEKEIIEKDFKNIMDLKNPLFSNLKKELNSIKDSDFCKRSNDDEHLLKKIGLSSGCQLNSTASLCVNEIKKICETTGHSVNDIREAIEKDREIFKYNYRIKNYFEKYALDLKKALSDFGLCYEDRFEHDFERIKNIRVRFLDEIEENGTLDDSNAMKLIGLNPNVFKTRYQQQEVIKIVDENRANANEPSIKECLDVSKKYNLYSHLDTLKGDDIGYLASLDKAYQQTKGETEKEELDDALAIIKAKIKKETTTRQATQINNTKTQSVQNKQTTKGGGIKHG